MVAAADPQQMEGDEVYFDKQLVITRTGSPTGLSVTGTIDYYNAEAVAAALTRELQAMSTARRVSQTRSPGMETCTSM